MPQNKPLTNQTSSDRGSMPAALAAWFRNLKIEWDNCLPAKVVSFDRGANTAVVQPLIMWVLTDDSRVSRRQLVDIPVLSLGGGAFHISFPLKAGDLGWIHALDRDISLFRQSLTEAIPPNGRLHSFSNGMFIPDVFRQYTIADEDSNAMVMQSTDGQTKISIRNDNILIASSTKVLVRVPLTEFSQDVQVDGKLTVTGATNVNGGFTAASGKTCSLPATTTVNNKAVDNHTHGGVQNGSGNTNPF